MSGSALDNNGNTLADAQGRSFTWDFENRLVQAIVPGQNGGTTTFKYDPFGRRIQKSGPLGTTNYLYDGFTSVQEVDNSGTIQGRYTQSLLIDEPLAEFRANTSSYYEQDGVGSTTSLSNQAGALSNTYLFDSFGKVTASNGTNPFQYTGREFDPETGLLFYRARYLDAVGGRFVSEDPVGFSGGNDFYSYVNNSPLSLIDPSGNAPCLDLDKFVSTLHHNALPPYGGHHCGRYVGWALTAGGANTGSHNGKDYGPYLLDSGFTEVSSTGYQPQTGDVVVIQSYPGNSAGHVAGFDGTNWVSDYIQPSNYPAGSPNGIYPGPGYRSYKPQYVIYRPIPCPTSTTEQSLLQHVIGWIRGLF